MNNNSIKILLTINLEGGVLVRQNEITPIVFNTIDGKSGVIPHKSLTVGECVQRLKINEAAYEYFKSGECPFFIKSFIWSKLSAKERVEAHLNMIVKDLKGLTYSYEILKD